MDDAFRDHQEAREQEDRDQRQTHEQAPPQAGRASPQVKSEEKRERKSNTPVRRDVGEESETYVAHATQRAGGDTLDPVEELERSSDTEQRHAQLRNLRIVR